MAFKDLRQLVSRRRQKQSAQASSGQSAAEAPRPGEPVLYQNPLGVQQRGPQPPGQNRPTVSSSPLALLMGLLASWAKQPPDIQTSLTSV